MRRGKPPLSVCGRILLAQNARGTGAFWAGSLRSVGKRCLVGCVDSGRSNPLGLYSLLNRENTGNFRVLKAVFTDPK